MAEMRIVDVTDTTSFGLVPPCADPSFDHRSCDYWEDATSGSKSARPAWYRSGVDRDRAAPSGSGLHGHRSGSPSMPASTYNPFLEGAVRDEPAFNPFALDAAPDAENPFAAPLDNPFAPPPRRPRGPDPDAPRKLALLQRGLGLFGSYAKVLLLDGEPVAYAQFGPLSAYPRALALRDLYPQLPSSPLPAVIACIATTLGARGGGHARRLVDQVCDDLARRGFAAVEAYPEAHAAPDATSAASPAFWRPLGFSVVVDDLRYPVVRREL